MRREFCESASEIVRNNENAALLLGDIGVFGFRQVLSEFPLRAINIGILEQSMVGVAAGFSLAGFTPIVHTIAPFMVERALEQIKIDFGYQRLAGNFVSVGASFDYAALGCTHHCPADISILSDIPGANLFIPGTASEFEQLFRSNWNNGKLNYFRLSENVNSVSYISKSNLQLVKSGESATVIVVGPILDRVIESTKNLDLDLIYVNNLGSEEIDFSGIEIKGKKVVIIEPYYSGPVLQRMSSYLESNDLRVLQLGIPRKFLTNYGTPEEHYSSLGFDPKDLYQRIKGFIGD
jgi:transketolase